MKCINNVSTKHENFGHVIAESLDNMTPLVISKNTPWRNLESECCGWDFDVKNQSEFNRILKEVGAQDLTELRLKRDIKRHDYAWVLV